MLAVRVGDAISRLTRDTGFKRLHPLLEVLELLHVQERPVAPIGVLLLLDDLFHVSHAVLNGVVATLLGVRRHLNDLTLDGIQE